MQRAVRRLPRAERDRLEALHLDVLDQIPAAADPAEHVTAVFDELERLSRAVVRGGLPPAGQSANAEVGALAVTQRCIERWQAEVAAELAAQNLDDSDPCAVPWSS